MISMISFDFIKEQSQVYRLKLVLLAPNQDEKLNLPIQKLINFIQCGKMVSSRQGRGNWRLTNFFSLVDGIGQVT